MSVHHAITEHSSRQAEYILLYRKLDAMREVRIEQAIQQCRAGKEINVTEINNVTEQINQLAARHHLPPRRHVTVDMIREASR
ncbi:DUF2533 family protein [Aneurinibacillus sp. Ricciae_BoGa-3]|uniref:DUF2533 family protein n=1 Tax=Aneurinibacillus sp. Ricciae_BoGa-3 TaxID=3022697 RepID=UPI0023420F5D|nr:DUF2533 family protein [Aneurinibacillus sp. Ricciae_BoGa-3]WCK53511.1 DUF2533 family protein [Aneurinibacillus sp. Ricciae_BoGa-3]